MLYIIPFSENETKALRRIIVDYIKMGVTIGIIPVILNLLAEPSYLGLLRGIAFFFLIIILFGVYGATKTRRTLVILKVMAEYIEYFSRNIGVNIYGKNFGKLNKKSKPYISKKEVADTLALYIQYMQEYVILLSNKEYMEYCGLNKGNMFAKSYRSVNKRLDDYKEICKIIYQYNGEDKLKYKNNIAKYKSTNKLLKQAIDEGTLVIREYKDSLDLQI